ncbi:hypothetical protein Bca4012_075433 [Brassica carinata]
MRHNCCHLSFASTLKILNFVQAFFGVSIIIYSIWMLDQYHRHSPVDPPTSSSGLGIARVSEPLNNPAGLMASVVLGSSGGGDHGFNLRSLDLPAPWYYNHLFNFRYSILKTLLILLEAALVAFIAIDRQWEKDLPYDPTGELNSLRAFIEDNIDICKWVGAAVLVVQLLSLLLAMVLRAMVSPKRPELGDEEDFENPRSRAWDPLLGSQANQASAGPSKSENWSSRIREKYGLNQSQAVNPKG